MFKVSFIKVPYQRFFHRHLTDYKIFSTLYFHLFILFIGEAFDMRNCATESFLTDPPTEEVRNIVNKGQRDFSVNIIKSLFDKYQEGS